MYTCHFAKTYLFQYGTLQDTAFYSWAASKKQKNCCPDYNLRTEKDGFNISFSLGFGQKVRWQTLTKLRGAGPLRTSGRFLGWETPWLGDALAGAGEKLGAGRREGCAARTFQHFPTPRNQANLFPPPPPASSPPNEGEAHATRPLPGRLGQAGSAPRLRRPRHPSAGGRVGGPRARRPRSIGVSR